jgi:hypothetical protein
MNGHIVAGAVAPGMIFAAMLAFSQALDEGA